MFESPIIYTLSSVLKGQKHYRLLSLPRRMRHPRQGLLPLPLAIQLNGRLITDYKRLDAEPLHEMILKLSMRRSGASAVPLELKAFSISSTGNDLWTVWSVEFEAVESTLSYPFA
jgi:hypothetical protein